MTENKTDTPPDKALIILITGHGKGKTTSAIGQAIRAAGNGFRVAFIQFLKNRECGEHIALRRYADLIDVRRFGVGFIRPPTLPSGLLQHHPSPRDETGGQQTANLPPEGSHVQAAQKGWATAQDCIVSGSHRLVILDELTYLLQFKMLTIEALLSALKRRAPRTHILITGRDAPAELMAAAHLVSRIEEVKHPYNANIAAQAGIEY